MIEKKNPQDNTITSNNEDQQQSTDGTGNPQDATNHNYLNDSTIYDNMIFPS